MKNVLAAITVLLLSPIGSAQVTNIYWDTNFDPSYAFGTLFPDEFIVGDLYIDFEGQYTGSQVLINLTSGSIVNLSNGLASDDIDVLNPPSTLLYADTAFLNGGDRVSTGAGPYSLGGGAVNIGGESIANITATSIDQAWNPSAGNEIFDQTGFLTLRVAFTPDATGSIIYMASANNQITVLDELSIPLPFPLVPEPVLSIMVLVGSVLLMQRGQHQS